MVIITFDNKEMLKEILSQNFSNVNNNLEFTILFDQMCSYYSNQNGTLNEINKQILYNCHHFLQSGVKPDFLNNNYTTKQEQNKFNNYKDNYNTMLNSGKPKEIDFKDETDETPIENMELLIKKEMMKREKELSNITKDYSVEKETKNWINSQNTNKKIKIHDLTNVDVLGKMNTIDKNIKNGINNNNLKINNVKNKKVRFEKDERNIEQNVEQNVERKISKTRVDNFLSKLKTVDEKKDKFTQTTQPIALQVENTLKKIQEDMARILENQKKIMTHLKLKEE